ncbi:aspartate/tyrosine/aromatic aminotransferase [Pseudoduganella ginsengisoli]|uniref:Aminotransferase class I/II-fold pyridoxal phosphate-dependent enzyme n=1 Tax=Pseudoduganella ginsengisoli TaxID=1462440 RepID=A0A6L6Q4M7_9BURK|nr:amino acid aminotransferase [Pseudoduganella ginsengisoli]MTW04803.1 aminotransferase class I/II-fold pyridoxal phosphate-dependent enzyme [Pseudoduganella ginsengisoli]
MFKHVEPFPGDPILTLNEQFGADPRPNKVNLSIGVYLNEAGKMPAMRAVLAAETALAADLGTRPYLPMEGNAAYRKAVSALTFGDAVPSERIAVAQTLGGSGALKVGGDFIARYFPQAAVWVSDPTWDNHHSIFQGSGLKVKKYRYFNPATGLVDFMGMLNALETVPAGDVVLLHACCHNPTGADLDAQQWREVAALVKRRGLLPFFDMAYQGFGQGVDEDAFPIRHFAAQGIPLFAATSFSKNFSLYGERCGSLSVVCADAQQADNVLGQLKATIRRNYSNPPTHGARIIARVLGDAALRADWRAELDGMRLRVAAMRKGLYDALRERMPQGDFEYLVRQTGMFSYTGLTAQEVESMRVESAVYLVGSGRLCIAALTQATIAPAADAMARVLKRRG